MTLCNEDRVTLFDLDHTLLPLDSDYAWGDSPSAIGLDDAGRFQAPQRRSFMPTTRPARSTSTPTARFATGGDARARVRSSPRRLTPGSWHRSIAACHPAARRWNLVRAAPGRPAITVVIVTATNEFVDTTHCRRFGVAELIAVELARDTRQRHGWIHRRDRGRALSPVKAR